MSAYDLLNPLIKAFDDYVAANGISKVYVTGHSMGGAMALEYMSHHSGSKYQAVTFAATPFGGTKLFVPYRKDYTDDSRITQIEIEKDTATMLFDQPNLMGSSNNRPGRVIDFGGDQTLTIDYSNSDNYTAKGFLGIGVYYWSIPSNHSMDYYRQITDSVDADSWTRILAGTADQTILLGGQKIANTSDFIVDGQLSGTNTSATSGSEYLSSLNFKTVYGGKGDDTLWAGTNNTLLLGGVGDDHLYGNSGNDQLIGGTGNDWLYAGAGADTMDGGTGNDIYYVDNIGDIVTESSSLVAEIDSAYSTITYELTANVENLTLTGTLSINGSGNSLSNIINGNSAANMLYGYSGVDQLLGGAGNDTLNGGTGADSMTGGDGSDIYYVDNIGDKVIETNAVASTGGIDRVYSYLSAYTLGANVENGRILSSGTASLTGNSLGNTLYAGAGSNILDGATGSDTASYQYAAAGVTVSLASTAAQATGGSGSDTLLNIENLTGSNYGDSLTGSIGNNYLNGDAGNDVLTGGLGADTLTGGTGADRFDFNLLTEMGLSSISGDTITDFKTSEGDKIDLLGVDANPALAGDQAFSFLGAVSTFTGDSTGKLRFDTVSHILYGSTDADTAAEFAIVLTGVSSLSAADFVL